MTVFKVTTVLGGPCWAITRDFGRMKRGSLLSLSLRERNSSPALRGPRSLVFNFYLRQHSLALMPDFLTDADTQQQVEIFYED